MAKHRLQSPHRGVGGGGNGWFYKCFSQKAVGLADKTASQQQLLGGGAGRQESL